MASICCSISFPVPPNSKSCSPNKNHFTHVNRLSEHFCCIRTFQTLKTLATTHPSAQGQLADEGSMSVDSLHRFIQLNLGDWTGSFHQFDANGNLMNKVSTKLAASSYGEDDLMSLIQTLYIKQPLSSTSVSGYHDEPEWVEYKIKESNMFTVDKYQQMWDTLHSMYSHEANTTCVYELYERIFSFRQEDCFVQKYFAMLKEMCLQIGFFPNERAFALRYQTAGMLETILRWGVLGEDDTGEESPRNLRLPSRQPSIVCENCLYSLDKDMRARAFHIMDPKGILDMLLVFIEERGNIIDIAPSLASFEDVNRILPFLGQWRGYSITKRSGVYGATIAKHDTIASLEIDENGQLLQDVTSTSEVGNITTNIQWTGRVSGNLVSFDKGFQLTLLPGGMYMGCPSNVAKSVAESKPFHLEFCWLESPHKRQRLVRTYDVEGLAVSSTYFLETKA